MVRGEDEGAKVLKAKQFPIPGLNPLDRVTIKAIYDNEAGRIDITRNMFLFTSVTGSNDFI